MTTKKQSSKKKTSPETVQEPQKLRLSTIIATTISTGRPYENIKVSETITKEIDVDLKECGMVDLNDITNRLLERSLMLKEKYTNIDRPELRRTTKSVPAQIAELNLMLLNEFDFSLSEFLRKKISWPFTIIDMSQEQQNKLLGRLRTLYQTMKEESGKK